MPGVPSDAQVTEDMRRMIEQVARGPMGMSSSAHDLSWEERAVTPIRTATTADGELVGIYGLGKYGSAIYAGDD